MRTYADLCVTYADLCVTYADLCGPMRTYAGLFGTKSWTRTKDRLPDMPFKCLSRRGACPPGGAAAPSAATAVTVSAAMRPAIADSQATEEQLRAGECVRAARPDWREHEHREELPGVIGLPACPPGRGCSFHGHRLSPIVRL